jgi:Acetyltransferase (GNAT) domain
MMPDDESSLSAAALHWEWYAPIGGSQDRPWLSEVRELRARVLFEDGRRPEFGPLGARRGDPDPLDLRSFHIVLRHRTSVVGCVRLTPIDCGLPSVTEQTVGAERLRALLESIEMSAGRTVEHGRWMVDPRYQTIGAGMYLMAASFALALKWNYPYSLATVSRNVVPILTRAGARRAPGVPPIRSERFDDELIVLYGRQREFRKPVLDQFQQMANVLKLGPVYGLPVSAAD